MQKNKITIISRNEFENADISTQSKQFYFDENKIHYENKLQIIENKHFPTEGINVVNNLCKVQRNKLTKTTFIYFQDKVIKIQDQIYLQNSPETVKVDSQFFENKKPIVQKANSNSSNPSSSAQNKERNRRKRKDLKNIVKNIVKIFLHWLNKYPKKQSCLNSMNQMLEFHKYNNSLIRAMSEIPQVNEAFAAFLSTESQQLVTSSRIHDKPTHLETLKKYEGVFGVTKKNVGMSTSGNGSNEGNSSENKQSGSDDKQKGSMNENYENMNDNMRGERMFTEPNGEMNEHINNSKGSDSDKLFNNSSSQHNRNRSMSSNKENYENGENGEKMLNHQNLIFFSSSGSDQ